ncbi:MAG: ATP-binding protein [Vicinamibacteria bacterium]
MSAPLLTQPLDSDRDVVAARQRARAIARRLGFAPQDQTRIAIAVSEVARNAVQHAGGGVLQFALEQDAAPVLAACVRDEGPGILAVDEALVGRGRKEGGAGLGLVGARRLVDRLDVESASGRGTTVWIRKRLPPATRPLDAKALRELSASLAREGQSDVDAELQQQNRELAQALEDLQTRHDDLEHMKRELEETNRGVVALYAELDEKAEHLRRADSMKTRFLSNVSHEFRTPLNSILAISRLLQERADGDLSHEQEKQVGFIVKAARSLSDMVDDLLDLAKVEAGKIVLRPAPFELSALFGALRGMLRPLLTTDSVRLVVDEPTGVPTLFGDEGKVAQILRNLLSNALKFTERGEVRVRAALTSDGAGVAVEVSDTGIGIAPEDLERIFDEFGQLEHAVQRRVKGTGLGLALSRRLAQVLGGALTVTSFPGQGSTFTLHLPLSMAPAEEPDERSEPTVKSSSLRLVVVDDDEISRYVVRGLAAELGWGFAEASSGTDGLALVRSTLPTAVVLDLVMPDLMGIEVLQAVRDDVSTTRLPVVVSTSKPLDRLERAAIEALGAVVIAKSRFSEVDAADALREALTRAGVAP